MADDARDVVRARVYKGNDGDRQAIERFRCAPYGDKPAEAAQRVIRDAPSNYRTFGEWGLIVVAEDETGIVGVIVFGVEYPDDPGVTIFSLGVKEDRQRQGIGIYLKRLIMAVIADMEDVPDTVISQVHRNNYKMHGLNKKLKIGRIRDPDDGEYFLTGANLEK